METRLHVLFATILALHSLKGVAVNECLTLHSVELFEQDHLDVVEHEKNNFTVTWKSKITPGLFYAVVKSKKPDYPHSDVMDLSDNRLDGAVLQNLLLLLQKVFTNGKQCPCGKGKSLIPKSIRCEEIDSLCYESTISVYSTGNEDNAKNVLMMQLMYNKSACSLPEANVLEGKFNDYFQLGQPESAYDLMDSTDDGLESLRNNDYYTYLTFRKVPRFTYDLDINGLSMSMNQESVNWDIIKEGEFKMTIYILRGPFLEDIAEAEYLTGTDGYIAIEFDLCSPPDYCDTCVEKLLVDVVYEFMFGGRITCPTEQDAHWIPEYLDQKNKTEPSMIRCQLSEFMIVVQPFKTRRRDPSKEFEGFSLNLDSLLTACVNNIECTGRDCRDGVV